MSVVPNDRPYLELRPDWVCEVLSPSTERYDRGAKVRYVQLPAEAHGYRARESVGHTLYEMSTWLDRWLKPTTKDKTKAD